MTPVWVFPAYPLLLTAPFGGNLISAAAGTGRLSSSLNAVPVALAAVTVQGTGFLISFMVCAAFLYRLMTQKLPRDHQRPGVFISIGPGGFTAAGLGELFFSLICNWLTSSLLSFPDWTREMVVVVL
jgi:tellurite resistance protein TehA-like permease